MSFLSVKDYKRINKLYWEKGKFQWEIANEYGFTNTGSVSKIVNGKTKPLQEYRDARYKQFYRDVVPSPYEPRQARSLRAKREDLVCTKLNQKQVDAIRKSYYFGKKTQVQLAEKYGVHQRSIFRILSGERWKTNVQH